MRLPPAPADLGQYLSGYRANFAVGQYLSGLGKLVGDTELPDDVEVRDVNGSGATGWYEIWLRGVRIGTLRPGGKNGRFLRMAPDPPAPGIVTVAPAPPPVIVATTSAPVQQQPIAAVIAQPAIVTATQPARAESIPVVSTTPAPPPIYPSAPAVSTLVEAPGAPLAPIADDTSTTATATATTSNTNKLLGLAAVGIGGFFIAKKLRWIK